MRCANAGCEAAEAAGGEWRKGWALRSGGFAPLCDKCGMAYEQFVFCDIFHQKESGWRECIFCGKRLHCGCIASTSSVYLLDGGGVQCIECMKNSGPSLLPTEGTCPLLQRPQVALALSAVSPKDEKANDFGTLVAASACELRSIPADCTVDGASAASVDNVVQLGINTEANTHKDTLQEKRESYNLSGSFARDKGEQVSFIQSANFSSRIQGSTAFSLSRRNDNKNDSKDIIICDSLAHPYRNISSCNSNQDPPLAPILSSSIQHTALPLSRTFEEGRDHNRTLSASQQVQRACHMLPKAQKSGHFASSEASNELVSHTRVARPPGEGRGRSQLLPRYWPRITEQELKQISGDSNSTIVPLFEKVLSVSDAGRIGRLVLPKACAEAYFPPISQPEGLPLKIQDARGKEWLFQFRFWPNNNSRMYVLEGVTPCIQSLQLQAGDTVTFSRIDPEGKLIMGFRKATNSVPLQDSQISAIVNGAVGTEAFFSGVHENLPIISGYSGLLQSLKGAADPNLSCLSEQLNSADGGIIWQRTGKHAGKPNEELGLHPLLGMEKKKSRNIGSKSKRLHMDNEDALELKLTWEEAQNLLRSPTSVKPSIVMIENYEFEEYEEPPVFGKGTIFTVRTSGAQDQWIQCDDCFKLRRLPVDVLLPSKWKCSDNIWDPQRSSCSIPDELSSKEVQNLFQQNADMRRQNDTEASGLDPLAAPGDENQTTTSTATTTKHPRHRPGCTCIVCIQPPSGKGPKHDPACSCNVCLTVKRRFKTLMMRKKKRQSEREEAEKTLQPLPASNQSTAVAESLEPGMGRIDLNYRPDRDGTSSTMVSMVGLLQVASQPLEMYLKQNGLASLAYEPQVSESEGQTTDERGEQTTDEGCCGLDITKPDDTT